MFLVTECQNYLRLSLGNRKNTYNGRFHRCDNWLNWHAWYRYEAGTQMATGCPAASLNCGAKNPGWLKDDHPATTDRRAYKTVCFRNEQGGCCGLSTTIEVTNCGSYYVYYLDSSDIGGCIRFCGSD